MYLSKVFEDNLKAYQSGYSEIVNQGGTRSSKTYSIMQLMYLIALWSKKPLIISVTSRHLPHLKLGSYRDWETDRKSTRLNSSHSAKSRMPSSA